MQLFQQVCEKSKDKDVLLDFDAPALPLLEKVNPEIKLALTHGGVETIRQLKRTEMDDIKKLVGDYRKHLQSQKAANEAPVVKNSGIDNPAPATVPTVAEKDSSVGISPSATADNTEKATIKDEKEKGKEDSGKAETESKEAKEKKDDKDDKDKPEEEVKLAHVDVVIIKDVLDMLSKVC